MGLWYCPDTATTKLHCVMEHFVQDVIFWFDIETSGLSVYEHELLEIAAIITDVNGTQLSNPYSTLVKPSSSLSIVLESASPEARQMHESNGLWSELWTARELKSRAQISSDLLALIDSAKSIGKILPGGTSLNHDLSFVKMELPDVALRLSHQVVDTTTLKIVNEYLNGSKAYIRKGAHRALPDTWDALNEYRTHISTLRSS